MACSNPSTEIAGKQRNATAGVSMIEVLIVLAIIGMIVALVAPRAIGYFGRAKGQAASIQINNIEGALQLMYIDIGRYPTEGEGLSLLVEAPQQVKNWQGPYLDDEKGLTDPWGRTYLYRMPGTDRDFDIFTYGRDGQLGGAKEDADISL